MLTPGALGEDLTDFFSAGQISTAISGAVTVELTEPAELAKKRLERARFDQAPVMRTSRVVGWVTTAGLSHGQDIQSSMISLEDSTLVSAETSIATILQLLLKEHLIFTVGKHGLAGFIVHSDIDRHAVRSYLYLLISAIEMLLAEIIKHAIPEDKIAAFIRRDMRRSYNEAHADSQETSPAEYLYIGELVKLFDRTPYASDPDLWDFGSKQLLEEIRKFRNSVMHPARSIAAANNIETAAHLPEWAGPIVGRLRAIIASIEARQTRLT